MALSSIYIDIHDSERNLIFITVYPLLQNARQVTDFATLEQLQAQGMEAAAFLRHALVQGAVSSEGNLRKWINKGLFSSLDWGGFGYVNSGKCEAARWTHVEGRFPITNRRPTIMILCRNRNLSRPSWLSSWTGYTRDVLAEWKEEQEMNVPYR